ncbi:MAG: hypothetical protein ACO4CH_09205 [Saprospiraceae bacterium]|jgi:hypothetical protein
MKLPVTSYVVFMGNEDIGAFAPAFPNLDKAEEFSNAMRLATSNLAISEPVPVTPEQNIRIAIND